MNFDLLKSFKKMKIMDGLAYKKLQSQLNNL